MKGETPRNKEGKAQEHDQGIRERSGWCSSWRVLVQLTKSAGCVWSTMISHGVEISIAGGIVEMVRGPLSWPVFILFYFIFFLLTMFIADACRARR